MAQKICVNTKTQKCTENFINFFDCKSRAKVRSSEQRTRLTIQKGGGFESLISSHPKLDGNGVKAMPGLNPLPNPGSFTKRMELKVTKWGTPKK